MIIENKLELISIVTGLIFFSGISRLYIFYKCFNITILPFIESDEILIITFDSILYFIIISTYLFVIILFFYRKNFFGSTKTNRLKSYRILNLDKAIFLIVTMVIVILFNRFFRPNPNTFELLMWCGLLIAFLYLVPILFFELSAFLKRKDVEVRNFNLLLITIAFIHLIFSVSLSLNEAYKVNNGKYYEGTLIVFEDGTRMESTSCFTFVGMTKNYLFFYDKVNDQTVIRPNKISKIISK